MVLALALVAGLPITGTTAGLAAAGPVGGARAAVIDDGGERPPPDVSAATATGYVSPVVPGPLVARAYDPPAQRWLPGHRGVDLVARPAGEVRAAGSGTVAFAGQVAGRPVLSIEHPDGLRTTYEPVMADVEAGDEVVAGRPVGRIAGEHPGCGALACLHWGARIGDDYVDPMELLGLSGGAIRLKSLEPGDAAA